MSKEQITLNQYTTEGLLEFGTYISPEGGFRPGLEGTFPVVPFTYSNWMEEEKSWHDSCYIHAGLNPFTFQKITGTEVLEFLTYFSVNTYKQFPIGKARHAIFCNEDGKVGIDGIILRTDENEYIGMNIAPIALLNASVNNKYDVHVEDASTEFFFFQLCGPTSLQIVEAAAKEDLHDIKFMYSRTATIAGKEVRILRTSMAGSLGYEVHGNVEDAQTVYAALLEAGKAYDLVRIGRHAYRNTHTEGNIPQLGLHFLPAEGYLPFLSKFVIEGSLKDDETYLYRSPIDLGWEKMISFKHDFVGKAALEKEIASHHNTLVLVRWSKEDILKVTATYFEDDSCDMMEMAEDFDFIHTSSNIHLDGVYADGRLIGASSGRMYSPKNHEMISMCTLDQDFADPGTIVEIKWGNPGTRQMMIRAEVLEYPYVKKCRNDSADLEAIPHPTF